MIEFDFKTCFGDRDSCERQAPLDTKLVALDFPIEDREYWLQSGIVISNVDVNRVDDHLVFKITIMMKGEGFTAGLRINGLTQDEIRCDPDTGNIITEKQRDGSWAPVSK